MESALVPYLVPAPGASLSHQELLLHRASLDQTLRGHTDFGGVLGEEYAMLSVAAMEGDNKSKPSLARKILREFHLMFSSIIVNVC
jgi:hypothetical protein